MKFLRFAAVLALGLMSVTGLAFSGDLAPVGVQAPEAQPAAICPLIGCVNDEYCRRNQDCTSAPNGVCNLFCPTKGCCSYQ
jgi:hypothetical protein